MPPTHTHTHRHRAHHLHRGAFFIALLILLGILGTLLQRIPLTADGALRTISAAVSATPGMLLSLQVTSLPDVQPEFSATTTATLATTQGSLIDADSTTALSLHSDHSAALLHIDTTIKQSDILARITSVQGSGIYKPWEHLLQHTLNRWHTLTQQADPSLTLYGGSALLILGNAGALDTTTLTRTSTTLTLTGSSTLFALYRALHMDPFTPDAPITLQLVVQRATLLPARELITLTGANITTSFSPLTSTPHITRPAAEVQADALTILQALRSAIATH